MSWRAVILSFLLTHNATYNRSHVLQTADKEAGANCTNLSLHRGKPTIKQRFQTGSVDELCFLGVLSLFSWCLQCVMLFVALVSIIVPSSTVMETPSLT